MKRIAKFEKVSIEQFREGWTDAFGEVDETELREIYEAVRLPKRATAGSAGYDFFAPARISLAPGETVKIPAPESLLYAHCNRGGSMRLTPLP